MAFSVKELLAGQIDTAGLDDLAVTGVQADSRAIASGELFFAMPGNRVHGDQYCSEAVAHGAVAIVADRRIVPNPGVPVIVARDVRLAYARAAARTLAPLPDCMVAVTGTNGKTSVASFLRQFWQASGIPAASIGTLGIETGSRVSPGPLTTPDPLTLHKSLAVLKAGDIEHVVLEASSHGLDQRRLDGISFQAVAFTNLSRDHLDYHSDMETYRDAKLRLFRELLVEGGVAVVNTDDPDHMPFMFAALDRGATLLTIGKEGAYIEIGDIVPDGLGQKVTGRLVGEKMAFRLPLVGRFQAINALMAAALAMATGADREATMVAMARLKGAKGRLEHVGDHNGAAIFVDYSHKPVALETALSALRHHTRGKLSVVFGCGGDRDRGKRPMMGEIATRLADRVIVTDDNPRTEDAMTIRAEILAAAPKAQEIGDRAAAIKAAMMNLGKGDVLLIAGKGHEDYQIVGTKKLPFSDHLAVKANLKD